MRAENFIGFFASVGFFVGLFFCVLAELEALELVVYTCIITLCFYLGSHILIMNYVDASRDSKIYFDKERYEEINDMLIDELLNRERKMDSMIQIKREKLVPKKTSKRKNGKKQQNERAKTKAA